MFPATAVVDAMQDGLLPHDFTTFGIQLFNGGTHRPLEYVSEVAIEDDIGNTLLPLTDAFRVDALGNLQPDNVAAIGVALAGYRGRELVLKAEGEDALGFTLSARTTFFITSHGLEVQLAAPPSNPALALGQVEIDYALMGTSLRLARSSDANGLAGFGQVPFGNTALTAHVRQDGREYHGEGDAGLPAAFVPQDESTRTLRAPNTASAPRSGAATTPSSPRSTTKPCWYIKRPRDR